MAQTVKRLSTMREIWVRSLGWEDPLEKEMAIASLLEAHTHTWASLWLSGKESACQDRKCEFDP